MKDLLDLIIFWVLGLATGIMFTSLVHWKLAQRRRHAQPSGGREP